jgi:hypothetical protein
VSTWNPLIRVPRYKKSRAFITRENNPRVIMLIGRVKILIIGLINILNKVRHAPTIRATQIGSNVIPEIILVVTKTATERIIQCKIIFIPYEAGNVYISVALIN